MLRITLFILLGAFSINLSAQVEEIKFGDISLEDLSMEVYPLDSGAEAVYLVDRGEAFFNESDLSMIMEVHIRLKILKESALDMADIELRYVRGVNEISKLKAATYNVENGKIVTRSISKKEWVNEKFDNDRRSKKLSFPDVKVGSIIEYTYRQKMGNIYNLPSWTFQLSVPVRYAEYKLNMPRYGTYLPKMKGYHSAAYFSNKGNLYHVVMKDVPALKKEPYVATIENFRSKAEFELKAISIPGYGTEAYMTNWRAINQTLLESEGLGKAIKSTGQLRRIYPSDKAWKNDKESMIDIYNYVRDHFEWNGRVAYGVVDRSKRLWDDGKGDNADINITLAQFLEKAGIKTYPVVLSTRGHGYLNQSFPLVKQFNYMIVCAMIGEEKFLLDATDKFRPYNVLPIRAMNGDGLMVTEFGGEWVNLRENKEMSSKTISGEFGFDEDLEALEGKMEIDFRGVSASVLRSSIYEEMKKTENEVEEEKEEQNDDSETLEDYKTGEVNNLEVMNAEAPEENLKVKYDFTTEADINVIGDKIFMSPVLIKHIEENPFKLEERKFPVELPAPVADTYIFKIKIPEGYEVEELPKSQSMALPNKGGRYMFVAGQQGDVIQVMVRLNLMKTEYLPEDYPALKELFNQVVAKQQEQIVFKEKSEE